MTCISCTASIDYVLVRSLEHILAVPLLYLILVFLCYSIGFNVYILLLVVYFVDFFSCENKSSSHKKKLSNILGNLLRHTVVHIADLFEVLFE